MKYVMSLENNPDSIYTIAQTVKTLNLNEKTKLKTTIILTEILENVNHYSKTKSVTISIRNKVSGTTILVIFRSKEFELFIDKIENTKIYFSNADKRYRGLGVIMYHNLSSSVLYKYSNECVKILIHVKD
ncbi:MAG: hypothetical protein ABDH28_02160 [Brevinematia bacterium]